MRHDCSCLGLASQPSWQNRPSSGARPELWPRLQALVNVNRDLTPRLGLLDQLRRWEAEATTSRALAAEGRTAQANAEVGTPLPVAEGIETEILRRWHWQTTLQLNCISPG
jgi:hypothetical protein